LLLEKPIAYSFSEATAIADAARQSKAVSMMGYMRAYDPGQN
jgi:predicted dehydrogenase